VDYEGPVKIDRGVDMVVIGLCFVPLGLFALTGICLFSTRTCVHCGKLTILALSQDGHLPWCCDKAKTEARQQAEKAIAELRKKQQANPSKATYVFLVFTAVIVSYVAYALWHAIATWR
jgi:hypothetical protein